MSLSKYSLEHLPDHVILRELPKLVARDRAAMAEILAHIAEVDARRLYVPAAYSSTVAFCTNELHMSHDSALKRIRVARLAKEFPAIYDAIADGSLSLTAIVLLKPHLTEESWPELIEAARGKSKSEIEELVARIEQPELRAVAAAPERLPTNDDVATAAVVLEPLPPTQVEPSAEVVPEPPPPTLTTAPLLTTFGPQVPPPAMLRISMDLETQELMRHAQALLSHRIPTGSPGEVLKRALVALIRELEGRKFAATPRPRKAPKPSALRTRHIPAHVKRAVRERDGFQCTFVSASGRRCESRNRLEFDHVIEFARGGEATVEGIRLRCHVHNQYTAEQTFGAKFMRLKRGERPAEH